MAARVRVGVASRDGRAGVAARRARGLAGRAAFVARGALVLGALVAMTRGSAQVADEAWPGSRLVAAGLRHADVSLMPEGTPQDYELFRPLRPAVVAWGEDGLSALAGGEAAKEKFAAKMGAYRRLGVREIATNVWMLTATERFMYRNREFIEATCVDLWGEKILPRWLADADYQGVKPWWGCTNHPLFAAHLLARMKAGLAAGATIVHLDDHSGTAACAQHAGGCFCAHCVAGFRAWLKRNVSAATLAAAGVEDVARFDYAERLRGRGYADRAGYLQAASAGEVPLRDWFLAFQRDAAIAFIRRMQAEAAKAAGRPVAFGVNAYNLLPAQLFDAHAVDYFANEVEHWEQEDLIPPVVYRLGEALGRPVFATGTGEDWIEYRQHGSAGRVHGWIAQAYAFGQYFMYSWRKWGFSEKTGTLWTEVPPAVFTPMTDFVHAYPELFDGFENAAATALLYDNASAAANRWGVRQASRALLDAGVPYGLVVAGDELLTKPMRAAELERFRALVVPGDVVPTEEMARVLAAWEKRGGRIVAADAVAGGAAALPGRIEVERTAGGRVWVLPRMKPASGPAGAAIVLQVLNRDYDPAVDAMRAKREFGVTVDVAALGGTAVKKARYFRPGIEPVEAKVEQVAGGKVRIVVPELEVWGIVRLE